MTVNVTTDAFPAASRALTIRLFVPVCRGTDTDHVLVPEAVPLPPRSLNHVTDDTPMLSLDVPDSVTVGEVVANDPPDVGEVMTMVGAVVSACCGTENAVGALHAVVPLDVMLCTCHVAAPAASVIPGDTRHVPPAAQPAFAAVVVDEITTLPVLSFTSRWYEAALVAAVHEKAGIDVAIDPIGDKGVAIPATEPVIVHMNDWEAVNTPSDTFAVTAYVPAVLGVPLIRPVLALTVKPGGRPVAP